MATLSARAIHQADELRALLRDEHVSDLGFIDVGHGSRLSFELAVRLTLSDLARLAELASGGHEVDPVRWQQVNTDLGRLHRLASTAQETRARAYRGLPSVAGGC